MALNKVTLTDGNLNNSQEPAQEDSAVGSLVEAVQLVAPIGNPLKPDPSAIFKRDANGKVLHDANNQPIRDKEAVKPTIVGYMFKATQDIDVPDFGIPKGENSLKKNRMGYENLSGVQHVKAGETFPLTLMEMAVLASKKEFNKHFGGPNPTTCIFLTKLKNQVTEPEVYPAQLQLTNGGSIKEMAYEEICELEETPEKHIGNDGNARTIIRRSAKGGTVKPGFEKFQSLVEKSERKSSGRAMTTKTQQWDDTCKKFYEAFKRKEKAERESGKPFG